MCVNMLFQMLYNSANSLIEGEKELETALQMEFPWVASLKAQGLIFFSRC